MAITDGMTIQQLADMRQGRVAMSRGFREPAALTATYVLSAADPSILGLDAGGGNRDVTLEGITTAEPDPDYDGLIRLIINRSNGAENLVCKSGPGTTIVTINQNEAGLLYHDGQTGGAGWYLAAVFTIAIS